VDNGVVTVLILVSYDSADSDDNLQGGYIVMVTNGSTRCFILEDTSQFCMVRSGSGHVGEVSQTSYMLYLCIACGTSDRPNCSVRSGQVG